MARLSALILTASLTCTPVRAQAVDVNAFTFAPPVKVVDLESRRFKGEPIRLAWSPDLKEVYVQFAERDRRGAIAKLTHVVVRLSAPAAVDTTNQEPAWAATYWGWKSAQMSPVSPAFRIAASSKEEIVRATGTPMGGDLARGGGSGSGGGAGAGTGVSVDEVTAATNQSQKVVSWTLRVKDEVIGEWVNQAVVPGLTFGWHARQPVMVFSARGGELVVMDSATRKKTIEGLDDTLLPAWSDDGTTIAALVKDGRRGWRLETVVVGSS